MDKNNEKTMERNLRHCQNCGAYRVDIEKYAGLTVCKACIKKLENSRMKKAQIAFDFVGNQNSLFSLLLIVVLMFSACGSSSQAKRAQTSSDQQQSVVVVKESKANSHLCNFPLKNGKTCKRPVSNEQGASAFCFQHREVKK